MISALKNEIHSAKLCSNMNKNDMIDNAFILKNKNKKCKRHNGRDYTDS